MTKDKTCLTYWFPILQSAGLPVPRTEIVDAGEEWREMLGLFDDPMLHAESNAKATAIFDQLLPKVKEAAERLGTGYPIFLRTGQFSGKHNWKRCCFVPSADELPSHVCALIEMSEMVGWGMLSWRYWCLREMLPVEPVTTLPLYGNMPLVREIRCFIEGGKILCHHPYWPVGSIKEGFPRKYSSDGLFEAPSPGPGPARDLPSSFDELVRTANAIDWDSVRPLAEKAAAVFSGDGAWSVDLLDTKRGWHVTDMAEAHKSFHWPTCEFASAEMKETYGKLEV